MMPNPDTKTSAKRGCTVLTKGLPLHPPPCRRGGCLLRLLPQLPGRQGSRWNGWERTHARGPDVERLQRSMHTLG